MAGPTTAIVKRLFAVSGNLCAFPDCHNPLVEPTSGIVSAEICHIKARSKNGLRYDASQTEGQRHGFDNLILMCPIHHKVIDSDEETYPVAWLLELKAAHEARYAGGAQPSDEITRQFLLDEVRRYMGRAVPTFEARTRARLQYRQTQHAQPYKFLYAFDIEDEGIFFGRDAATEALYDTVFRDRLTVLHARSGAGKTSLLNAGLSPRLIREGYLPVCARAYDDPIRAIKQAIAPPSSEPWPDLLPSLSLQEFLGLVCNGLSRQTKELVLILDQFEEFLIFGPERDHRKPFIDALTDCYQDRELPMRFVIGIRKDYYSDLADFQQRMPTILYNEYRLGVMTRKEAKMAVTGPVDKLDHTVTYQPALLDELLDDLMAGGMELPHLQIICSQLYEELPRGETAITLNAYEAIGRAEGVLGRYLQDVLDRLPSGTGDVAKAVLTELVSSEATKRVLSYSVLAARIQAEAEVLDEVLAGLVNRRLLHRDEVEDEIRYEMAHEYLIDEIVGWIDREDLAFKQVEELLAREMENWRVHGTLIPLERLDLLYQHRERLIKGLDDESWQCILLSASQADSRIEDWARVGGEKHLLAALVEPRLETRRAAMRGLGRIWGLRDVYRLAHEVPSERLAAAEALGQTGDARAVEPLAAALGDEDSGVRLGAAWALGQIGSPRAVEPLIATFEYDDSNVGYNAAEALGMIGEPAVKPLIAVLGDERSWMRPWAALALKRIGEPAMEPLIAALRDKDASVRQWAAPVLGAIGDVRAVEPLAAAIKDEDSEVRFGAARALGEIRDARAVEPLAAALKDEDSEVRGVAADALGQIGGAGAVELLAAALKDEDSEVRLGAARALGEIRDARAVEPLAAALKDEDSGVRLGAAGSLGRLGDARAVEFLIAALGDEDRDVQSYAARALRTIDTPEARAALEKAAR